MYKITTIYNNLNSVISNLRKEKCWLFPMYVTMQLQLFIYTINERKSSSSKDHLWILNCYDFSKD